MARLQEELNRYNKEGVDLFRKNSVLQKESPISDYSLNLKEQVGAQQSFQREHVALKQLLQKNPGKFKQWNADTLNALRALPETINNPDDYQKVTQFYMKNPSMMWEGARYISQLQEKMNRINVLKRWLAENPKSMDRDDWEQQLLLLAEDLAENERRAPFIVNRKAVNTQGWQPVYKTASNNKKDTNMLTKAASAVYREKLTKNAPMTNAVVGNAKKNKQQKRSMNGFLKRQENAKESEDALNKSAAAEFDPDNLSGSNYDAFRKAWAVIKGLGKGALYGGLAGGGVGLLTDSVLAGKDQRNAKISILTPAGAALGALAGIPIGISSGLKNERMEREKERRSAYQQALMDKLLRGAVDPAAGAAMLAATKE